MKVIHVISNFSLSYGGMAIACKEIAEFQLKAGIRSTVITSNLDQPNGFLNKPLYKPVYENGVRIIYCQVLFKPLVFSFGISKCLMKEISNADLVHIHGLYRFPQSFAGWYANKINKPYIISPHGSLDPVLYNNKNRRFFRRLYQNLFEIKNIQNSSRIHFTASKELELANYLKINKKGVVIPNGINTNGFAVLPKKGFFYRNYGIKNNTFKILFLGRISWKKGLDIILESLPQIIKSIPNVILIIAGPDNERYQKTLCEIINKFDLAKYVKFIGMLDKDEVKKAYVNADIFLLPSYSENFGLTIIESMACGCPIIISRNVNIYEKIDKNNLGYVIDCKTSEITDSVIDYYYKPDSFKKSHSAKIKNFALTNYDWDLYIKDFITLYEQLL